MLLAGFGTVGLAGLSAEVLIAAVGISLVLLMPAFGVTTWLLNRRLGASAGGAIPFRALLDAVVVWFVMLAATLLGLALLFNRSAR